jgi:3-hydroxyanthranilate 3,4-dioxygenase
VRSEVVVREGEMYLLPSHVRHSPQRPEGCIGLVIERYRQPGEVDALEWYDEQGNLTFRGEFLITNIETDLNKVQSAWQEWVQDSDRTIPTIWRVGEKLPAKELGAKA